METRANHILIGAFTLVVVVCGLAFALWVGKSTLDREWDEYDILFSEAVTGLSLGGAVQYSGIQVGEVRKLSLDPKQPGQVRVHVRVSSGTPIRTDTRAKLTFTGLTGVAIIQLSGGSVDAPPLVAAEGEPWPVLRADHSDLQRLLDASGDVVGNVNTVAQRLTQLLDAENLDRVADTLSHLERITGSVASRDQELSTLLDNLAATSADLRQVMGDARTLFASVQRMASQAEPLLQVEAPQTLERARAALDAVQTLAQRLDTVLAHNAQALQGLGGQTLAQLGPTLTELRGVARELQRLSAALARDPAGLLLGRDHPKEYPLP